MVLSKTENPEKLIAGAARLCYSPSDVESIMNNLTEKTIDRLVNDLARMNHDSPFEHATITFGIDGVSRALSHQLVRHRIASYNQQSQRYVQMDSPDYIVPDTVRKDAQALGYYTHILYEIKRYYDKLIEMGIPKEDARYILPNAAETRLIVTMNFRTLINFFKLRTCNRAQWEIRDLADEMLKVCRQIAPRVFGKVGPSCVTTGNCDQGKMFCGEKRVNTEWD